MASGKIAIYSFLTIFVCTFYFFNFDRLYDTPTLISIAETRKGSKNWLIDTKACLIPFLDPMHPSVEFLVSQMIPLQCETKLPAPVLQSSNSQKPSVQLVKEAFQEYGSGVNCSYSSLQREDEQTTSEGERQPIDKPEVYIADEFIKVECLDNKQNSVYTDFFPFIQRKKKVEMRLQNSQVFKEKSKSQRFSVLLIGIDSLSRNQYLRHFKTTDTYLRNSITFVELLGYNKIGRNTFPNIAAAMLTGKKESELPNMNRNYANTLPVIWKDFASAGYRTLFSEDFPAISIFNFARRGFSDQPTDYYLRPFSLAVDDSNVLKKGKRGCYNHRLEADVILNWTEDFFDVFPEDPLFALTFLTRLSHDDLNEVSLYDEPFYRFFKRLNDKGHLNRTIVFFFGDHGFRFGDIRNTYIGRLEDKLPFMSIFVPSWFPANYPTFFANLKTNSKRLTSPLDIHATLQGILHFPEVIKDESQPEDSRSMNLLKSVISENRTCEDAAIEFQYCACTRMQQIEPSDQHVVKSAQKLVKKINEITKSQRNSCAELSLDKIEQAKMEMIHLGESSSEKSSNKYMVTFRVSPSEGLFEGTVWYWADMERYTVHAEVDRINLYGNQSVCIDIANLKPFCYCPKS